MAALDAALAGLGIVRMRSYQVAGLVAERKLRVVLAPFERAPLPVHLARLPGVQTRAAAAFIAFAAERIRERLRVGGISRDHPAGAPGRDRPSGAAA